jgi:phage regulator Rha-like protein
MKRSTIEKDKVDTIVSATAKRQIFMVRGQAVMMDAHLAGLYEVETKNLIKAVSRNLERFPSDFMFQLSKDEAESLRFQFGTSKTEGRGGRRYLPYAFTEHGVAMLSGVLRSKKAVQVNIEIMRAFVKMKQELIAHNRLAHRMDNVEKRVGLLSDIVESMIKHPEKPKRKIGFRKQG